MKIFFLQLMVLATQSRQLNFSHVLWRRAFEGEVFILQKITGMCFWLRQATLNYSRLFSHAAAFSYSLNKRSRL
jgi:hypothetical protein